MRHLTRIVCGSGGVYGLPVEETIPIISVDISFTVSVVAASGIVHVDIGNH